jgi:hypothetical protein
MTSIEESMRERQSHRPIIHIALVAVLSAAVAPLGAQASPVTSGDFSSAAVAEVRNAQGQVVLTGRFLANDEDDDDVERKAKLASTAVDADAVGEAEVEIDKSGNPRRQEVEFELTNLQPSAAFTLVIDGKVVATVNSDARGRVSLEREIPLSATTP